MNLSQTSNMFVPISSVVSHSNISSSTEPRNDLLVSETLELIGNPGVPNVWHSVVFGAGSKDPSKPAKKAKKKVRNPPAKQKKKSTKKAYTGPPAPLPWSFRDSIFNILPPHAFPHPRVHFIMSFFTIHTEQQKNMLNLWKAPPFSTYVGNENQSYDDFWSPKLFLAIRDGIQKIKRVRRVLKLFVHHCKFHMLQRANEQDPVTLEVPRNPIWLVDWLNKRKYMFEPRTIAKDITERLLTHDGFFEDPQPPRNPFTNTSLTLAQCISIWNQLSESNIATSSAFAEYRRARYQLHIYQTENLLSLQLHAFRSTMKNPYDIDTQERTLDFITYAYDQEGIDPPDGLYSFVFRHYAKHSILKTWMQFCQEFYEIGMIHFRSQQKLLQLQGAVLDKTIAIINKQHELMALRRQHIRLTTQRRTESTSGLNATVNQNP